MQYLCQIATGISYVKLKKCSMKLTPCWKSGMNAAKKCVGFDLLLGSGKVFNFLFVSLVIELFSLWLRFCRRNGRNISGSNPSRGFPRKRCSENVQLIYRKYPCRSMISVQLLCYSIEIALQHGCSLVNLLHIFRTPFYKNTYDGVVSYLQQLPFLKFGNILDWLIERSKLKVIMINKHVYAYVHGPVKIKYFFHISYYVKLQ